MATDLPRPTLPSGTIELAGATVTYHSLSRSQAIHLNGYKGQPDEAEDWIIACGLGISVEEAHAWRDAVALDVAGPLVDAILEVSGLTDTDDAEEGADPKG